MLKYYTYTLALSAILSGSLLFFSCDSSSSSSGDSFFIDTDSAVFTSGTGEGVIDPEFQSTVDRFIFEAEKRNITVDLDGLDILYGNTNQALGICSFNGNTREITMNPDLRDGSFELLQEIILHELGHCVLGRPHSPNPRSIMHATNIIGQPWRKEVLDELFFGG